VAVRKDRTSVFLCASATVIIAFDSFAIIKMNDVITTRAPEIIVTVTTVAQGYADGIDGNIIFAI